MFKNMLSIFTIFFVLFLAGPAQSAQISESGKQFNACTSSSDREVTISEDGSSSMCCSKKLGYCMSCSHLSCVKVEYSISHPTVNNSQSHMTSGNALPPSKPPTLRDQIKQRQLPASAPENTMIHDKAPSKNKPVKQYQRGNISPLMDKAIRK